LAAEQGFASAQTNLGIMYAFGYGVEKSYVDAYMWGGLGASNGSFNGGKLRDDFARRMSATEVKEAKRRARECVKKNYKGC
jgi:TPR repeat protein